MEEFRKKVSMRVSIITVITVIYLVLYFLFMKYLKIDDRVVGFIVGSVIGIVSILCFFSIKYRKALKNEYEFKKLYNYENDERRKLIKEKTSKITLMVTFFSLPIFATIFGANNELVFKIIVGIFFYILIVFGILKVYFMKKF